MYVTKRILIFSLIALAAQESASLRAQQSPCYEFLCGTEPSLLCGSDGVTYLNGCTYSQAQCKNPALFVETPGACRSESAPSTPDNAVETEQVDVSTVSPIVTSSPSSDHDPCADPFCSTEYKPVCGSDGITYSNLCQFSKAQCRNSGLALKHEGRCKSFENCLTRICPMREESLCGTDGKTYRNLCELSIAKCYNPSLEPVNPGPCPPGEPATVESGCGNPCEDQYRPVCATDGKTYPNICHFENAKCKNNKLKIFKFEPC